MNICECLATNSHSYTVMTLGQSFPELVTNTYHIQKMLMYWHKNT